MCSISFVGYGVLYFLNGVLVWKCYCETSRYRQWSLTVCVLAHVHFCPCCRRWRMLSRRQGWKTTRCFLLTIVRVDVIFRNVRSFTCGGYSDRAPCKIRKYPYPLYSILSIKVNASLCIQAYSYSVHIIRRNTFNASFNFHVMFVSGVHSKSTKSNICCNALN